MRVSREDVRGFLYRTFGTSDSRKKLLVHWHNTEYCKHARLADAFEEFICTILHRTVVLHMTHECFHVFGENLSVRYEWLRNAVDREVLVNMVKDGPLLFKNTREFKNGQFHYSVTVHNEHELLCWTWKRQIVRDFVWMVCAFQRNRPNMGFVIQELIVALQHAQMKHRTNLFLYDLERGVQGRGELHEILCWDMNEHPDEQQQGGN